MNPPTRPIRRSLTGRSIRRLLIGRMLLFVCFLGTAGTPVLAQSGRILGRTLDAATGAALSQVHVLIEQDGVSAGGTTSDAAGRFRFDGLAPGRYTLDARYVGYRVLRVPVEVDGASDAEVVLRMEQDVLGLDAVEVEAAAGQDSSDVRVSLSRLTPRQARELAGGGEDVLRTLQALPGVVAVSDYSNQLVVRGGTPDQNLILLDGIEIFSPYQLSGVGSLLNPDVLRAVELYAGAFPAVYGDRLSSVLAVETRDGEAGRWIRGQTRVNLSSVHLTLEGETGFWDGTWLVSGRRTYYGFFANTFARRIGVFNDIAFPEFEDVQGVVAWYPARGHKVRLTGLYSSDALGWAGREDTFGEVEGTDELVEGDSRSRNAGVGLVWSYTPRDDLQVRAIGNWYRNRGGSDLTGGFLPQADAPGLLSVMPPPPIFGGEAVEARFVSEQRYAFQKVAAALQGILVRGRHTLEAGGGVDFLENDLDLEVALNDFGKVLFDALLQTDPVVGALADSLGRRKLVRRVHAFVQDRVEVVPGRVFVQPGLRYDGYGTTGEGVWSPRLNVSIVVGLATTLRLAAGRYVQSPGFEKLFDPSRLFTLARFRHLDSLGVERALHLGAGLSRSFGGGWQVRVEAYYKRLEDLLAQRARSEVRPTAVFQASGSGTGRNGLLSASSYRVIDEDVLVLTPEPVNQGRGEAYGAELLLEKQVRPDDPWSGWVSYALARAVRQQPFGDRTVHHPFDYDRRHTLSLTASRRFGTHLRVGVTWRYGSGFPYTPAVGLTALTATITDPDTGRTRGVLLTDAATGYVRLIPDYGEADALSAARLPAYHRLDARIAYGSTWAQGTFEVYVDLINLYNRKNVLSYQYYVAIEEGGSEGPVALRPPPRPVLYREPVYMFPFIPSFGFSISF